MFEIKSIIVHNELYKLGFEHKTINKVVFINKHKWLDVAENDKKVWSTIKNLELYLIEFKEEKLVKTKEYLNDGVVERNKYYFVIVITYNKYIFFINDRIKKLRLK